MPITASVDHVNEDNLGKLPENLDEVTLPNLRRVELVLLESALRLSAALVESRMLLGTITI